MRSSARLASTVPISPCSSAGRNHVIPAVSFATSKSVTQLCKIRLLLAAARPSVQRDGIVGRAPRGRFEVDLRHLEYPRFDYLKFPFNSLIKHRARAGIVLSQPGCCPRAPRTPWRGCCRGRFSTPPPYLWAIRSSVRRHAHPDAPATHRWDRHRPALPTLRPRNAARSPGRRSRRRRAARTLPSPPPPLPPSNLARRLPRTG